MRRCWHDYLYQLSPGAQPACAPDLYCIHEFLINGEMRLVELDGVLLGGDLLAALVLGGVGGAAVDAGEGRDAGDGGL